MRLFVAIVLAFLLPSAAPACDGDCDDDGQVRVEELILGVQIALGGTDLDRCAAADRDRNGVISIADLLAAVEVSLFGCAATPTVAATATPTPTPPATATATDPGPIACGDGTTDDSEECDDGNRADSDGCSALCTLEPGGNPCAGIAAFPGVPATTVLVTDAVDRPVDIGAPPLDPHRLFVVEQLGRVRIIEHGVLREQPFLDIVGRVSCCGERGLLGIAFHPDFESNGRFFVNYTNRSGDTVIARYQVGAEPNRVDPNTELILLTIDQPYPNHNGGQVAFGPDGYLYVGMGDGGSGGDPQENAQDDGTLLGKMLRLDVNVEERPYYRVPPDNPHPERGEPLGLIWAKGLRNPWRYSFDRATGDLYIGDVGQGQLEEIDVQPAASVGGENYGWDIFEGTACYEPDPAPACPDPASEFVFPVHEYGRGRGCSVTGGFVYRGCALPDLHRQYFFSDYCTAFLETFALVDGVAMGRLDRTAALAPGGGRQIDSVVSFGVDARGELYLADYDGEVYRLAPASAGTPPQNDGSAAKP